MNGLRTRIGIDLGGTKVEIVALDESGGTILRRRVATPAGDYEGTVRVIAELVRAAEMQIGKSACVGIGAPGSVSPASNLVRNANSTVLIGKPFAADLERALGREIRIANDADCFALSEAIDGAAQDGSVVFGAILGTGVGGGIAIDKHVLRGANGIAGEWGHNSLPFPAPDEVPGRACYCGRRGCIEAFLSGPALSAQYREATGNTLAPTAIAQAAENGDAAAVACMNLYVDRLARAFASIINVLDPDVIVLGGGVSNIPRLYADVPAALPRYVFSDVIRTRIVRAAFGDSSGVRGAALLWPG